MPRSIFVDAGAWVGLSNIRDPYHQAATAVYAPVRRQWSYQVTTNLVIAEAYTLIRRAGHAPAIQFLVRLQNAPNLVVIRSNRALEAQAAAILQRYTDQDFSYTDAVSFAVMRAHGIIHAFTFDNHFAAAGFILVPSSV